MTQLAQAWAGRGWKGAGYVLALVAVRYLKTKLRPAELAEDRLQPWEYQDTLRTDDDEDYPR